MRHHLAPGPLESLAFQLPCQVTGNQTAGLRDRPASGCEVGSFLDQITGLCQITVEVALEAPAVERQSDE